MIVISLYMILKFTKKSYNYSNFSAETCLTSYILLSSKNLLDLGKFVFVIISINKRHIVRTQKLFIDLKCNYICVHKFLEINLTVLIEP